MRKMHAKLNELITNLNAHARTNLNAGKDASRHGGEFECSQCVFEFE